MARNRVNPKPKLRDLSKKTLSEEEVGQLLEALNNPRQAPVLTAIYGASIVEHDLEQLLRPRIGRNDSATWELLTSEAGPLNTLHQKILIGYAIGAFGEFVRRNLDVVRNIRNAFAHTRTPYLDFDHELVKSELRKMVAIPRARKQVKATLDEALRVIETDGSVAYIDLCASLVMWMMTRHTDRVKWRTARLYRKTAILYRKADRLRSRLGEILV
jgi:hypothetical protein